MKTDFEGYSDMDRLKLQYDGLCTSPQMITTFDRFAAFELPIDYSLEDFDMALAPIYRLGQRVEYLFSYWLYNSSRYNIIKSGLQINDGTRTIGELDFLVKDTQKDTFIHLELAYKFYCLDPDLEITNDMCWIGPNRRDSFCQKKQKMLERQLPLLYNSFTKEILESINIKVENISQQVCFFGQLFIPLHFDKSNLKLEHQRCIVGHWINVSDFKEKYSNDTDYFIPAKQDWLIKPSANKKWLNYVDIIEVIEHNCSNRQSTFIWIKKSPNAYQRCFVVWWGKAI